MWSEWSGAGGQVKARVTDDAAGLAAAQSLVSREIETVQKAKQAHAAAQHDRADSLENAFVSQVPPPSSAEVYLRSPIWRARALVYSQNGGIGTKNPECPLEHSEPTRLRQR